MNNQGGRRDPEHVRNGLEKKQNNLQEKLTKNVYRILLRRLHHEASVYPGVFLGARWVNLKAGINGMVSQES